MFKFFGSIFRWFGLRLGLVQGSVDDRNARLMRNPTLIRQEGEAIAREFADDYQKRFRVVKSKVASRTEKEARIGTNTRRLSLVSQAKNLQVTQDGGKDSIQKIGYQLYQISKMRTNAAKKMRTRGEVLGIVDGNGKIDKDNPVATGDREFTAHRDALTTLLTNERDFVGQLDVLETELKETVESDTAEVRKLNAQLITDKATLRELERKIDDLPGKTEDVISAVLDAEEKTSRDGVLQSIDSTNANNRLANLLKIQKTAVAEGSVADEMTSGDIAPQYLANYSGSDVDDEIDALLNPNAGVTAKPVPERREAEHLPNG